ncbi:MULTISPECIES: hypothetical protein [Niastella]|uniref:Glycosyltransferase RgtA/B/C/D-like domain-containing protein n=1 Tax=Niastella soli TaxID=2821487 RepID=A0ABS3YU48_9BACT|nr:hypothetical protein [Niastella soli]MBO9201369.1 hypothetical protein [Niastella soli]
MTIPGILFYSIIFIFILFRLTRRNVPLTVTEVALAFLFKVVMGCLYGYIYLHYYNGDDTWLYHNYSPGELEKLKHDTGRFFMELLPAESFAKAGGSFWHKVSVYILTLENDGIIKMLSIADIFSGGNYYINVVFFNFILFWGHYWLFSFFVKEFPDKRKPLLWLIFFFPPLVFWLSGIRGDGLLLFFTSLLLLQFRRLLYEHKKRQVVYCIIGAIGVIIYRSQVLLLLIPALLAWSIVVKFNRKPVVTFLWVYCISGLLFFATSWVSPAKNLPGMIMERQHQFLQLKGTRFPLDSLQPTVTSYARVLPQAVSHTFFRPYVWEAKGALQIMTAAEIIFCWLLVFLAIIKRDIHSKQTLQKPLILFCLAFSITLYIFIGYVIPFPGAIVRYKAIPELLLLSVAVICTNWSQPEKINKNLYI